MWGMDEDKVKELVRREKKNKTGHLALLFSEIEDIKFIENLNHLTQLYIGNNKIKDIEPIKSLTNLIELHIEGNKIISLEPIGNLNSLNILSCKKNQIKSISSIKNLDRLTYLDCDDNQIKSITAVKNMPNLKMFDCSNNQITNIEAIKNLINLEELNCSNNPIKDLTPILYAKSLKTFIYKTSFNQTGIPNKYLSQHSDDNCLPRLKPYLEKLEKEKQEAKQKETNFTFLRLEHENDKIKAWVAKLLLEYDESQNKHSMLLSQVSKIPNPVPSSLEAEWQGNKLIAVNKKAEISLDAYTLDQAVLALKQSILDCAGALLSGNNDKYVGEYLSQLADKTPNSISPKSEVFFFGHQLKVLRSCAKNIQEECNIIISSQYYAMILSYDETMMQFPEWKAFIANAEKIILEEKELANIEEAAQKTADYLKSDEAKEYVDNSVPALLEKDIEESKELKKLGFPFNAIEASKELVKNTLNGIGNIIKSLAKKFLEGMKEGGYELAKKAGMGVVMFSGTAILSLLSIDVIGPIAVQHWPWLQPIVDFIKALPK